MPEPIFDNYIDNSTSTVDLKKFFEENADFASDYDSLAQWVQDDFGVMKIDTLFNRGWLEYNIGLDYDIDDAYKQMAETEAKTLLSEFGILYV